jgi:hypothetical protein
MDRNFKTWKNYTLLYKIDLDLRFVFGSLTSFLFLLAGYCKSSKTIGNQKIVASKAASGTRLSI